MKVIFLTLLLSQLAFGAYIDCQYFNTTECEADPEECFIDEITDECRANCTKITFFRGMRVDPCEVEGCVMDTSSVPDNYEGMIPCSFTDLSRSPTLSPITTTSIPTSPPTAPEDTPSPTDNPTTMIPTTDPTTTAPTSSTTRSSGGGRCKADGSVQEQLFGPGEYQCGDYNLGQPEERCLYIDASSTCNGTEFMECGNISNPWPTFQSALDSLDGETVVLIVKAGVYSGEGNVNITSPNINNLNEYVYLNIFSESGSDDTVIDCKGEGFGFHWYKTTIRMDGFTVINCIAPERPSFSLPSYAKNSYIASGPSTGRLGGAFFLDRTFITMNDMIIVNNGAEFGGGIFQYQNSIRMNNSIVEYNCATNSGGGIFLLFANIYMWNSYVICNDADVFGGGIFGHQQRTDILENALVDENTAEYADEVFCDQTTVNVDSDNNGLISDNDIDSWGINEKTYCCCNNCAFYNLDRSIDFCSRSDNSLIDVARLNALKDDEGTCQVEITDTPAPTVGTNTPAPTVDTNTPAPTVDTNTPAPTADGDTKTPTESPVTDTKTPTTSPLGTPQTSNSNGYKLLAVTFIVTMIFNLL